MRPVTRGERPKEGDRDVTFSEYAEARGSLIDRIGEYCSYCEMHLDSSLHVEHVRPKKPPGASKADRERELDWNNFLLACTNCNSTKGNEDVDLNQFFWPDRDNTFLAFTYSEGGLIEADKKLSPTLKEKARRTIELTGLDRTPDAMKPTDTASDRRWFNRKDAWDRAQRAKQNLAKADTFHMREVITMLAEEKGYWSVWMTVFESDADMLRRLIDAHKGTAECFDNKGKPLPRHEGQI